MLHALSFDISNIVYWRHILLIPQRTHLAKSSQISVSFQVQVHLFTLIQLQYNNNKEKKRGDKKEQS